MGNIVQRLFTLDLPPDRSAFLWGPRKIGKSHWIAHHLPDATVIDLLKTDLFAEYAARPALLRERFQRHTGMVVIDEVQKIPMLLDEVHWLIENSAVQFLLTGSSARKLRRGHANLLGGRAWTKRMTPLASPEIDDLDLESLMVSGLVPPHFLSSDPLADLRAYVADYLKEEIAAEALTQHIPSFSEFLHVAALTNSELLNYTNVSREAGVSAKVVRNYFQILEDTYLGFRIKPWIKSRDRRMIETEKFYLFDVGLANYLARRAPKMGTPEFGKAFEHFILMELTAYQAYRQPELAITFWRTSTNQEVDFLLNDKAVALEIKASRRVHDTDTTALQALHGDGPVGRSIIVCLETEPRQLSRSQVEVLPWKNFLEQLWAGDVV